MNNQYSKETDTYLCAIRDVGTSHFHYIKSNGSTGHVYLLVKVRFKFSLCAQ
jgi:hypothetical protein